MKINNTTIPASSAQTAKTIYDAVFDVERFGEAEVQQRLRDCYEKAINRNYIVEHPSAPSDLLLEAAQTMNAPFNTEFRDILAHPNFPQVELERILAEHGHALRIGQIDNVSIFKNPNFPEREYSYAGEADYYPLKAMLSNPNASADFLVQYFRLSDGLLKPHILAHPNFPIDELAKAYVNGSQGNVMGTLMSAPHTPEHLIIRKLQEDAIVGKTGVLGIILNRNLSRAECRVAVSAVLSMSGNIESLGESPYYIMSLFHQQLVITAAELAQLHEHLDVPSELPKNQASFDQLAEKESPRMMGYMLDFGKYSDDEICRLYAHIETNEKTVAGRPSRFAPLVRKIIRHPNTSFDVLKDIILKRGTKSSSWISPIIAENRDPRIFISLIQNTILSASVVSTMINNANLPVALIPLLEDTIQRRNIQVSRLEYSWIMYLKKTYQV